ncbi:hypothetical protein [Polaromonas sp. P5_D5]
MNTLTALLDGDAMAQRRAIAKVVMLMESIRVDPGRHRGCAGPDSSRCCERSVR